MFAHVEHCIIITMVTGECQWSDLPLIKKMMTGCQSLSPIVRYAFTTIPTYPNGQIGMVLASINKVRMIDRDPGWVCDLADNHLSFILLRNFMIEKFLTIKQPHVYQIMQ